MPGRRRCDVDCTCGHHTRGPVTNGKAITASGTIYGQRANKTPEFRAWRGMLTRCYNTKRKDWKDYGGRGILVCDEWRRNFPAFLAHVGLKPSPDLTIERINNEGNYEPGNVRWATQLEQQRNRRPANRPIGFYSPLSAENVIEIRKRREAGELLSTLAVTFGVTESTISAIYKRKTWQRLA